MLCYSPRVNLRIQKTCDTSFDFLVDGDGCRFIPLATLDGASGKSCDGGNSVEFGSGVLVFLV